MLAVLPLKIRIDFAEHSPAPCLTNACHQAVVITGIYNVYKILNLKCWRQKQEFQIYKADEGVT